MKKTDDRLYNRKAKRDLLIELDLWIAYQNNGEQPILLAKAIAPPSKGYNGDTYELYYAPSDICKTTPYLVRSEKGITHYSVRSENITKAKYLLKKENPSAKWTKLNRNK